MKLLTMAALIVVTCHTISLENFTREYCESTPVYSWEPDALYSYCYELLHIDETEVCGTDTQCMEMHPELEPY